MAKLVTHPKLFLAIACSCFSLLTTATRVTAASITFGGTTSVQDVYLTQVGTEKSISQSITVPQFAPSLGILNQVTLTARMQSKVAYTITSTYIRGFEIPPTYYILGGFSSGYLTQNASVASTPLSTPFDDREFGESRQDQPGASITGVALNDFATGVETLLTADLFASDPGIANFIGNGDLSILLNSTIVLLYGRPTVYTSFEYVLSAGGSAELTYDYTPHSAPVPTPALLPGLVGFGMALWQQRQRVARPQQP